MSIISHPRTQTWAPRQDPVFLFSRSSHLACRISSSGNKTTLTAMPILRGSFDGLLRPGRRPRRSHQEESLLLQLPVELLLDISGLLPSVSAVALAFTCRSLFGILFPKEKLHGIQLDELLQRLERDLSNQCFFCQLCHTLHRFSPSWMPGHQDRFDGPCKAKVEVHDTFHLGFHFARPAMNKHLLGEGIELEQLPFSLPANYRGWNVRFTARVIKDELYLCVSHALSLNGTGPENRQELDASKHGICNHVTTHRPEKRLNLPGVRQRRSSPRGRWFQQHPYYAVPQRDRVPELAPRDSPSYSHALVECRDARGSCPVCLTDYSIMANRTRTSGVRNETAARETWDIVIIACHQLGPCRSQSDWKWLTYATQLPVLSKKNMDESLLGRRSKIGPYAPESVRARWDQA